LTFQQCHEYLAHVEPIKLLVTWRGISHLINFFGHSSLRMTKNLTYIKLEGEFSGLIDDLQQHALYTFLVRLIYLEEKILRREEGILTEDLEKLLMTNLHFGLFQQQI
jgi:hypothetical protein